MINSNKNKLGEIVNFSFRFVINMHKDDASMLYTIAKYLKVGSIYESNHFVAYTVFNKMDLLKIFNIFYETPLNTSKNLNYLAFKKAYYL
jgi:CCR4-NOT transcriptional regulation complex NOT5 subunit